VNVETGEIIDGELPNRAKKLILEWWSLHQAELAEDWALAQARSPLKKIAPLE